MACNLHIICAATLLAALLGSAGAASANPNLVQNGDFTQTSGDTNSSGSFVGGQMDYGTTNGVSDTVADWSTTGYNFIFGANATGTTGTAQYGALSLWSQASAGNGFTGAGLPTGSTGSYSGNYIGADGAYEVGAVTQSISGLQKGDTYALTFYWAAAQQSGFTGPNTEQWQVSLGGQTQSTAVYSNSSHGFSGWMEQTFDFTATTTGSELLSFLAVGTPAGEPPFSLLEDVSMTDVPEPASWALLTAGLLGMAGLGMRRRSVRASLAI